MAHMFTSGVFLHNKPAWHKLGVVLDGTLPAREAFRIANADFNVEGRPVFDADMKQIAGYQAITRMDTGMTLSVMTETYTPIQNDALIRIAEALYEDINMDAVCVIADGKKVTFTAKVLGAERDVVPGDPVQQYLIGCTSHDGSIPFQLLFSPIRVVCQNTLSAALGLASHQNNQNSTISIRHTKNSESLIHRLPELVDLKRRQFTCGIDELRHMAKSPCSMQQFRNYASKVFSCQLKGKINDVRGDKRTARTRELEDLPFWPNLLKGFEGQAIGSDIKGINGTAWSAYQCITEYLSHDSGKCKDPIEASRKRFESLYWGQSSEIISRAHTLALTL